MGASLSKPPKGTLTGANLGVEEAAAAPSGSISIRAGCVHGRWGSRPLPPPWVWGQRQPRGRGSNTVTPAQPKHHAGPGREVWIPGTPDPREPWLSWDHSPYPSRALGSQDLPAQALGSYRQQPVSSRITRNTSQDRAGINACFVLPEVLVGKAISHQQEYALSWCLFILGPDLFMPQKVFD